MSIQNPGIHEQTLYRADSNLAHNLKSARDRMHQICRQYTGRLVRVETMDGDVFEGIIVHCDKGILYLRQPGPGSPRGFAPMYYNDVILPLVLYELLVITLLYT
ncbi:hypothetical protein [Paenibacillus humicola]|uniref:hypothetical protein n=1 Tax=Paenibacillus humicola TaxID=3110540 RepID=UPI00237A3CD4|nr:hypothetical protein [Paenibacillus humicola]